MLLLNTLLMPKLRPYLDEIMPTLALPVIRISGQTLAPRIVGVDTMTSGSNVLLLLTGFVPVTLEAPDPGSGC